MTALDSLPIPDPPLNVLLVCTRDPRGRLSGRKMVLRTIIDSLTTLGHQVTVAYFGETSAQGEAPVTGEQRHVALPDPSMFDRLPGAILWIIKGLPSLNEALYRSRRAEAALRALARETGADVVVTDMLRTAQYGASLGLPWIADLDDLLSRRYANLAAGYTAQSNLLGYHPSRGGRALLWLGSWLMPAVLRREAAATARREIAVARLAQVTTLVSAAEAEALSQAAGCTVHAAPMAVAGPAALPTVTGRSDDLVFVGGLDYGPNLKSVLHFDRLISPALADMGLAGLRLRVIGQVAGNAEKFSDRVVLDGYVDDLDTAVQSHRAMLVPEVLPGGVKTKIIVAALNGTIVLAHQSALDGMGLRDGVEVLAWETSDDLANCLRLLHSGDLDLEAMAKAAHLWAQNRYGPAILAQTWHRLLASALRPH